jgi:hypothetical protein
MANKPKCLINPEDRDLARKLKITAGVNKLNRGTAHRDVSSIKVPAFPISIRRNAKKE